MNKKEQMRFMRSKGASYREIAQAVGCSYQYVANILGKHDETKVRPFGEKDCVYPGLREWLNTNKCSKRELYRKMYGYNMIGNSNVMISDRLHGRVPFRMDEINLIISITGLTYEQLFLDKVRQGFSQDMTEQWAGPAEALKGGEPDA